MKRTALLVALLALPGCLTECGAVGHGVIGRGVVSDGAISGGAVGGRPTSGCVLPGSPSLLFDADSIAQSDATSVTTWADEGSLGRNLTKAAGPTAPVYDTPCEGGGVLNESACVIFDGNDNMVTAAFTATTQPTLAVAVYRVNTTGAVFDGDDATNRQLLYTAGPGTQHTAFAGSNLQGSFSVTSGEWVTASALFNGASSALRINGSEATGNPGTKVIDGLTMGSYYNSTNYLTGAVAWFAYYDDTTGVTAAQVENYLTCRFGSFPQ